MGWPYTTRVDGDGVHRTGPWLPWRCGPVRAGAAACPVAAAWLASGSALLAGFAAGLSCWIRRVTR